MLYQVKYEFSKETLKGVGYTSFPTFEEFEAIATRLDTYLTQSKSNFIVSIFSLCKDLTNEQIINLVNNVDFNYTEVKGFLPIAVEAYTKDTFDFDLFCNYEDFVESDDTFNAFLANYNFAKSVDIDPRFFSLICSVKVLNISKGTNNFAKYVYELSKHFSYNEVKDFINLSFSIFINNEVLISDLIDDLKKGKTEKLKHPIKMLFPIFDCWDKRPLGVVNFNTVAEYYTIFKKHKNNCTLFYQALALLSKEELSKISNILFSTYYKNSKDPKECFNIPESDILLNVCEKYVFVDSISIENLKEMISIERSFSYVSYRNIEKNIIDYYIGNNKQRLNPEELISIFRKSGQIATEPCYVTGSVPVPYPSNNIIDENDLPF